MQIIENDLIKEKAYIEVLENGMKFIFIPKKNTDKKYVIWATKFGSIDNHFIEPKTNKEVRVPDGVAHYLEHKMFEQESGEDSLFTMMALGLDANAYTTNDHTAYLFSCTDNFYEGLDELMDFVQHPYYTDQNVEKERGIIGQEIQRYDDEPIWKVYLNAMKCLYKNNGIRLNIAGTVESISHITKEILYSCYNTFYHPSNMTMCICGDFKYEEILSEVKKRLLPREKMEKIERIYPEYETTINKKKAESYMDVNMPLYMIGYRDYLKDVDSNKKDIAIKIIFNSLLGKCSKAYQDMYNDGLTMRELNIDYEFSDEYSHILIDGESTNLEKIYEIVTKILNNEEVNAEEFERSKKRLYGEFVTNFEDVEQIGRMFIQDALRNVDTIDYINQLKNITLEEVNDIKNKIFKSEESILSIVRNKN